MPSRLTFSRGFGRGCGRRVARSRRSGRMARSPVSSSRSSARAVVWAGWTAAVIGAFVVTLAGYQPKTVEHKLCAVRSLLRFAATDGLVDEAVLGTVPAVRSVRQARIPSVWDPVDVAKVLEAIDRANPSGKRDYAIVLLICRLGLRAVDVKRLEFADLDWPGNQLSVVQAKTGRRVVLPLLKDVGWAIIDYVRDGRPQQRLPAGVSAAYRSDRPVLRPGPSASDPGQARPRRARAAR